MPPESVLRQNTPPESVLRQATPPESVLRQNMPPESVLRQATPLESVLRQNTPPESVLRQATPLESVLRQNTPPESGLRQATPPESVLRQATPHATPPESVLGQATPPERQATPPERVLRQAIPPESLLRQATPPERQATPPESMLMLAVAVEAFQSQNFDLAAEIYKCEAASVCEAGAPGQLRRRELTVRCADALAHAGKFSQAFSVYRQAAEEQQLHPELLQGLVECLRKGIQSQAPPPLDPLCCALCWRLLLEPVTLVCGHCVCKSCVQQRPLWCGHCTAVREGRGDRGDREDREDRGDREDQGGRVNVVLCGLLSKLYPELQRAGQLRQDGDQLQHEGRHQDALDKYNQAIHTACDPLVFMARSQIHSSLKHLEEALSDADTAVSMRPDWAQGHLLRAQALIAVGRCEEALRENIICLSLDPNCRPAQTQTQQLLAEILAPVPDQIPDQVLDHRILSSRFLLKTKDLRSVCSDRPKLKRKRISSEGEEMKEKIPETEAQSLDPSDVECSLCMRLFLEPVTTPCGHTFCLQCLERCLDHNPQCPLCKEFLQRRRFHRTVLLENLIFKHLPSELSERQKLHREEMDELSNLTQEVPIFVCTVAFPTVPCPLHVSEPCYRLMIRRCLQTGTRRFGMCLQDHVKGFSDVGCLLEIREVELLSDGGSVLDTIGRRRFKVLRHQQRDGYNTADIQYLEDRKVEGSAEVDLLQLHDCVYELSLRWFSSIPQGLRQRIQGHFGAMPLKDPHIQASPNGPSWCWWLLAVLPLEGRVQLLFSSLTSLRERLCGLRKVLLFITRRTCNTM